MKIDVRKRTIGTIPILEVVQHEYLYEQLPLIIYYHGWQTAKELVLTQGRKLAAEGFRVVLPDAMNHGERKTSKSEIPSLTFWQSIHTNLFEFEAIVRFFDRLQLTNGVIGVGGVSMGGMTTCALLTKHPEIKAAACVMGSPDLKAYRERIAGHAELVHLYLPKDYQELLSWTNPYDLAQHPDSLGERPLFFWHGTEDEKIPITHIENFIVANPKLNVTYLKQQEKHLVKSNTMDEVTQFFVKELL